MGHYIVPVITLIEFVCRYIDILSLSPDTGVIDILKSGEIDHLAGGYGPPEIVKIHGNITAVYQELYSTMEGALTISLWRDNLSLTLTEVGRPFLS